MTTSDFFPDERRAHADHLRQFARRQRWRAGTGQIVHETSVSARPGSRFAAVVQIHFQPSLTSPLVVSAHQRYPYARQTTIQNACRAAGEIGHVSVGVEREWRVMSVVWQPVGRSRVT